MFPVTILKLALRKHDKTPGEIKKLNFGSQ